MKKKKLVSYKYCEYCGEKLIDSPREDKFDKFTGKQLLWLQCKEYDRVERMQNITNKHSRWVKELVTDIEIE